MKSSAEGILYSEQENIAVITLNRPQSFNTFRAEEYSSLCSILQDVHDRDHLRALVITGNGSSFCAGQDLAELGDELILDIPEQKERLGQLQHLTRLMISLPIPSVVAFNGFSVGFGLELSLACDFRIAVPESYFMFPEARRGLLHTNGTLWLLPRIIGLAASKEMLLQGAKFDADYALKKGLISAVYPQDVLFTRALELAGELAGNSRNSIAAIKGLLDRSHSVSLDEMLQLEIEGFLSVMKSPDFKEGVMSFLEKRKPRFL